MVQSILALDAGTTGVTALVLDADRSVQARAYAEFTQHYPMAGRVEHDATEIWDTARAVAREALKAAKVAAKDVGGIGVTDQRETTVVWDANSGRPVAPAIVWQDGRTAKRCGSLRRKWAKTVHAKTGLVLDPYFSATKIEWLLEHVHGARKKAEAGRLRFGTIDSWLAWNMTGKHVTDDTNASRTMLYDIHRSRWDQELCDLFGVPDSMLPEVRHSTAGFAEANKDLTGTAAPLSAMVGDQQASLFGQGCQAPGQAKNTYGTGCFLLQHTGTEAKDSKHGLLTTRAASTDGTAQYALEGSVFMGGAAVQWLRDGLGMIQAPAEADGLAASVADSDGVVVVPAFVGLGAPHWDPEARGAILGLTRGSTKAHLARATLEGIAHQCQDVLDAMRKDAGRRSKVLRVDGGAARSDLLMQMQADLLGAPIERPNDVETTAYGAGLLAGIHLGMWSQRDTLRRPDLDVIKPVAGRSDVRAARKRWKKAVASVRRFGA